MESIGIPTGWEGAGVAGLFLFFLLMIITGRVYFKWQVDKMFKDKDQLIETLTKQAEQNNKIAPLVVKILEELNRQADAKSGDSNG